MSASETRSDRAPGVALRLLALAVAGGAVYAGVEATRTGPCWAVAAFAVAIAYPIWRYLTENAQFTRRLLIEGVSDENSTIRRVFWAGHLVTAAQAVLALVFAGLLLILGTLLAPLHWAVLAADVVVLALLAGPVGRVMGGLVRAERSSLLSRRWPLALGNVLVLSGALFVVDYWFVGAPDTRGAEWGSVAERAFAAAADTSGCTLVGWICGGAAALDALLWHASQIVIPALPDGAAQALSWLVFLGSAGLLALIYTRVMLGGLAALEEGRDGFTSAFGLTVLALTGGFVYAVIGAAKIDPETIEAHVRQAAVTLDPCGGSTLTAEAARRDFDEDLLRTEARLTAEAEAEVDRAMAALDARLVAGVDAYLDWYFTVLGEYERLAALATGDFVQSVAKEMESRIYDGTGYPDALAARVEGIERGTATAMAAEARRLGLAAEEAVGEAPCLRAELGTGATERIAAVIGTPFSEGGVAGAAVAVKLLARRAAARLAGRALARPGFRAVTRLVARGAAKRGGGALAAGRTATAICAPSGPFAVLCGIGAGLVTWIAIDIAAVEIDEAVSRETMRAELIAELRAAQDALAAEIKTRQAARIVDMGTRVQEKLDAVFIPADGG
ncbi:MAG: hypothetical protein ACFBSD_01735 [Paracoccaceae bacterium]